MIGAIFLFFILYGFTQVCLGSIKKKYPLISISLLHNLFWFHMVFWCIYYLYTLSNPSDSIGYYRRSSEITSVQEWLSKYGTGTSFIDFAAFPLVSIFGFSYEMMMLFSSYLGYWGFVFFYIFFKENIRYRHKIYGYDFITVLMFLPNMHFWTASLGKGSFIFLGIGLAAFGFSKITKRKLALILGLLIVYHVRAHVFLFISIGIVMGLLMGRQKIPLYQKVLVLVSGVIGMFILYDQILGSVGLDSENVLESFEAVSSHRAAELSKAGSGVDTTNYPLILKLFTFWFRPLFFDAPGALGLFVSLENLLYVVLAVKLFDKKFIKYLIRSSAIVKASVIIFLASSIALSTTMANLGIIIRQKSMVMYFFFFLILSFLDYKKQIAVARKKRIKEDMNRTNTANNNVMLFHGS